jgi:hypothetical protein
MGTLSSRESVIQKALERSVGVKPVSAHAAIFGDAAYKPSNERLTFKSVTQTAHSESQVTAIHRGCLCWPTDGPSVIWKLSLVRVSVEGKALELEAIEL